MVHGVDKQLAKHDGGPQELALASVTRERMPGGQPDSSEAVTSMATPVSLRLNSPLSERVARMPERPAAAKQWLWG